MRSLDIVIRLHHRTRGTVAERRSICLRFMLVIFLIFFISLPSQLTIPYIRCFIKVTVDKQGHKLNLPCKFGGFYFGTDSVCLKVETRHIQRLNERHIQS